MLEGWVRDHKIFLKARQFSKRVVCKILDCYLPFSTSAWKMYSVNQPNLMYFKGYSYLIFQVTVFYSLANEEVQFSFFSYLSSAYNAQQRRTLLILSAYFQFNLLCILLSLLLNSFRILMTFSLRYFQWKYFSKQWSNILTVKSGMATSRNIFFIRKGVINAIGTHLQGAICSRTHQWYLKCTSMMFVFQSLKFDPSKVKNFRKVA